MKIYFLDKDENKNYVGEGATLPDCMNIVTAQLQKQEKKPYYLRTWTEDNVVWVDFGSHIEFFLIERG